MRKILTSVALGVVGIPGLLGAAGCSGADPQPVAAQSSASPSASSPRTPKPVTAKPTPTRLTVAQARTRYLAVTRPYNVALERFETAANNGAGLATLKKQARAIAAANLAESRALAATAWPTNVASLVRELIAADAAARTHWLRAAGADSLDEMARHVRRAAAAGGQAPSAEIRRRLGLPKYDEKDYT